MTTPLGNAIVAGECLAFWAVLLPFIVMLRRKRRGK
jgi:hypothetical protein